MGYFTVLRLLTISLTMIVASVGETSAQECNMDRKSILYGLTMCNPNGCTPGQERIDFVGGRIVHYSSAANRLGTVYQAGKTVDFCNPQLETYRSILCSDRVGPVRADGAASFSSGHLQLTLKQYFDPMPGRNPGVLTQYMYIVVEACGACNVQDVSIVARLSTGQVTFQSRMTSSFGCQVVDTATLPH